LPGTVHGRLPRKKGPGGPWWRAGSRGTRGAQILAIDFAGASPGTPAVCRTERRHDFESREGKPGSPGSGAGARGSRYSLVVP
jgi:hypothetical protein